MTVPCTRTGPVFSMEAVPWMAELQTFAVEQVHAIFNAVTLNNCHSAVTGTGGTIRPKCLVEILRALMETHEKPDSLLDVGCAFGHIILAALLVGFAGSCGCELPSNMVQRLVFDQAKAKIILSAEDTCEWIGSDVMNLILTPHLRQKITAVYSFWFGISPAAQRRTLDLCRETFTNVRSLAVYLTRDYSTPEHGMAA